MIRSRCELFILVQEANNREYTGMNPRKNVQDLGELPEVGLKMLGSLAKG